jgi:hypothetical protein
VPAALLGGLGFATGWHARGAQAVEDVASDVHALAGMHGVMSQTAATLQLMTDAMTHGVSPAELMALIGLRDVLSMTAVAKVPDDTVPSPCIAAVPDGAIRTVAQKPVKACVIALKDTATVRGGDYLTRTISATRVR